MKRITAALALTLTGCAPMLQTAGVDPGTAQVVEARVCAALPGRFDAASDRVREAADIIMALSCPARASLITPDPVEKAWACLTTTYYRSNAQDEFDAAHRAVCEDA